MDISDKYEQETKNQGKEKIVLQDKDFAIIQQLQEISFTLKEISSKLK